MCHKKVKRGKGERNIPLAEGLEIESTELVRKSYVVTIIKMVRENTVDSDIYKMDAGM